MSKTGTDEIIKSINRKRKISQTLFIIELVAIGVLLALGLILGNQVRKNQQLVSELNDQKEALDLRIDTLTQDEMELEETIRTLDSILSVRSGEVQDLDEITFYTGNDYASILSTDNLQTCTRATLNGCRNNTDSFSPGTVYVWARINAPKRESIQFKWLNEDGTTKSFDTKTVNVNTGNGYRIFAAEGFTEPGNYTVVLSNSINEIIGSKKFTVN